MTLLNSSLQITSYTNDFGQAFTGVPFKISNYAVTSHLTSYYQSRAGHNTTTGLTGKIRRGVGIRLRPRHFVVKYGDGEVIKYPINSRDSISAMYNAIKNQANSNGSGYTPVKISLVGERYGLLTRQIIGHQVTYQSYNGGITLATRNDKESSFYTYTTDIDAEAYTLRVAIPYTTAGDTINLQSLAELGLADQASAVAGVGLGNYGIKPRKLIGYHLTSTGAKVVREIVVSNPTHVAALAEDVSVDFLALHYKGESVRNVADFL